MTSEFVTFLGHELSEYMAPSTGKRPSDRSGFLIWSDRRSDMKNFGYHSGKEGSLILGETHTVPTELTCLRQNMGVFVSIESLN